MDLRLFFTELAPQCYVILVFDGFFIIAGTTGILPVLNWSWRIPSRKHCCSILLSPKRRYHTSPRRLSAPPVATIPAWHHRRLRTAENVAPPPAPSTLVEPDCLSGRYVVNVSFQCEIMNEMFLWLIVVSILMCNRVTCNGHTPRPSVSFCNTVYMSDEVPMHCIVIVWFHGNGQALKPSVFVRLTVFVSWFD